MPNMISLKKHNYGGSSHPKGSIYPVRSKHVRLLKALGWVDDFTPTVPAEETVVPAVVKPLIVTTSVTEEEKSFDIKSLLQEDESEVKQSDEYSKMLRARAESLGIHVDGRWSDARVQREIDEHNKKTYQTTHFSNE